jgi:hypothetical protein
MPTPPPFIDTLIDELDANRAMFEALCVALTPARLPRPVPQQRWSVADHLAHVASYDQLAIGPTPADSAHTDADAWNDAEVARRAGRPTEVHLGEMESLRSRSLALLRELRPARLDDTVFFPGDARRGPGHIPLRLWLDAWSRHDMIHAHAILRALPELDSADFQAWFQDDPVLDALQREGPPP